MSEQWMPIETAPLDGTPIIVAIYGGPYYPRSCWWSQTFERWVVREDVDAGKATGLSITPTHWMSLPMPPGLDLATRQDDQAQTELADPSGREANAEGNSK